MADTRRTQKLLRDPRPLRDLDAATRGGVDPRSPWPGGRGDGRRSGRSIAQGITKAKVASHFTVPDVDVAGDIAVDEVGRLLVGEKRTRRLVYLTENGDERPLRSERELPGLIPWLRKKAHAAGNSPLLLAEKMILSQDATNVYVHQGETVSVFETKSLPWVAGLRHLACLNDQVGVQAVALEPPHQKWWETKIGRKPSSMAIAHQAQLVVLTKSGLGDKAALHRFELANGHSLNTVVLDDADGTDVVIGIRGTAYVGLGRSLAAIDAEGTTLWRKKLEVTPVALAGEDGDVLIVATDPMKPSARAYDAPTGNELWVVDDTRLTGLPKIDARGLIYWRRADALVALDPKTGAVAHEVAIGAGSWEFAFAGKNKILVARHAETGGTDLIVVE
jgi:hypothetical protein